eukprot:Platyproteum_vivax@DN11758_c0_g1_i1.p1
MHSLRLAFDQNDINYISKLLNNPRHNIGNDPFIKMHLEDLLRKIRSQGLRRIMISYSTVSLNFLANELGITRDDVLSYVVKLIVDKHISATVDDVTGFVTLRNDQETNDLRFRQAERWMKRLSKISNGLATHGHRFGSMNPLSLGQS